MRYGEAKGAMGTFVQVREPSLCSLALQVVISLAFANIIILIEGQSGHVNSSLENGRNYCILVCINPLCRCFS